MTLDSNHRRDYHNEVSLTSAASTGLALWWRRSSRGDDGALLCVCVLRGRMAGRMTLRFAADCELSATRSATGQGGAPAPDRVCTAP